MSLLPWSKGSPTPLDKGGKGIAVAPSHCFTYRKIRLPAASSKIHHRIVQEELTFGLPFPLHQCSWDYYKQSGPEAFAVVAQLSRWQGLRARWGVVAGVDPEPLCYLRVALKMGIPDALIVDFGASHTTWVSLIGGRIEWVRTMMRGGQAMSQALADDSRIPLAEAEELKRRRGTELPQVQSFLSELLEEALIAKPLAQRRVLLCGGGSSLPGLRAFLHTQLGVEPEPFPLPPLLSPHEHVSAYGAALAGVLGQQRLQFQSGKAPVREGTPNQWLAMGATAAALWLASTELRYQGVVQQQRDLRTQFRKAAADMGVTLPPGLKTSLEAQKWLDEQTRFRESVRRRSVGFVADSLGRAAQGLREVGDCQLYSLTFDDGKVGLEGEASSQLKVQQLRQKWQQVFSDFKQIKVQKTAGTSFRFEFEGGLPK